MTGVHFAEFRAIPRVGRSGPGPTKRSFGSPGEVPCVVLPPLVNSTGRSFTDVRSGRGPTPVGPVRVVAPGRRPQARGGVTGKAFHGVPSAWEIRVGGRIFPAIRRGRKPRAGPPRCGGAGGRRRGKGRRRAASGVVDGHRPVIRGAGARGARWIPIVWKKTKRYRPCAEEWTISGRVGEIDSSVSSGCSGRPVRERMGARRGDGYTGPAIRRSGDPAIRHSAPGRRPRSVRRARFVHSAVG